MQQAVQVYLKKIELDTFIKMEIPLENYECRYAFDRIFEDYNLEWLIEEQNNGIIKYSIINKNTKEILNSCYIGIKEDNIYGFTQDDIDNLPQLESSYDIATLGLDNMKFEETSNRFNKLFNREEENIKIAKVKEK